MDRLAAAGFVNLFEGQASGAQDERAELVNAPGYAREGNTPVVSVKRRRRSRSADEECWVSTTEQLSRYF